MKNRVKKNREVITLEQRHTISERYERITNAVNREFWDIKSKTENSRYVGSYGRGTAISTSDIDMMVVLPSDEYNKYDNTKGNGQSRLLQAIREAIMSTYPQNKIRADGQVVILLFNDNIKFEILPAFKTYSRYGGNICFKYPDTHMGGNWLSTNPIAEQIAIKEKNINSNGLLFDTCKHIRYIRDNEFPNYKLSGIVIDSFVYAAIGNWRWINPGEQSTCKEGDYERTLYEYCRNYGNDYLIAPGSRDNVNLEKSKVGLEKVLYYMCHNE